MPKVTYVHPDGSQTHAEGAVGASVMQTAVDHGVDGIVAECGGNMMCATCHVYVDASWVERVGAVDAGQDEMLEETASPRAASSRLSCQIALTPALDGLVVRLPETQI